MSLGLSLGIVLSSRGGGFTPAALAGAAHWYRSDLGITLNGGTVSQWNDQIGTAHLTQATGANQPTYNATDAAYNNKPTIQAAATGHYLAAAASTNNQVVTLWVVGNINLGSSVLAALSTSGPYIADSTKWSIFAGTSLFDAVTDVNGIKHAFLATFNGASSFAGASNWLTGGVSGAAGANNGSSIGVLAASNGTLATIGKIAELIIQAGTPTAAEKTAVAAYFLARYGITVT